ncbi:hypothetical protein C0V75_01030 [Tabrizicola sp. TH137]|uniref:Hint domain-containing protein n=1 Tax=Tabrizicola sp. TH137 TaxID=2067452 RepID=UPI000C79C7F2|nr:Hint domain-containing protein [Tabrizicola sp. TH137]PLL14063.1 hypothetical protein C0V75_01030 [Tabrizicola sp. TH137]
MKAYPVQSSVISGQPAAPAILVDGLPASLRLSTPDGWLEAGELEPGDPVLTFEQGEVAVRAVHRSAQAAWVPPAFWPVVLPPGAMLNDHPVELLPAQMVLLESELAEAEYGEPFVMVPALALLGWNGIRRCAPRDVELVHLQFDAPQVVFAGGCLFLGCGGIGRTAANLFRCDGLVTLRLAEARRLVADLVAEGNRAARIAARHGSAYAAFAPAARA